MSRTCKNCGCPLGAADIEAAQCPVCRKTVWRHVVDPPEAESSPVDAAPAPPDYRGTMVPPASFESADREFAVDIDDSKPHEAPPSVEDDPSIEQMPVVPSSANADRENSATLDTVESGTSATIEPEDMPPKPVAPPVPEPRRPPVVDRQDEMTVTVTSFAGRSGGDSARHGATVATIDPRNFADSDWDQWAQRLSASMAPTSRRQPAKAKGDDPSLAQTADIPIELPEPESTSPRDSRYVGKTDVAQRILTRDEQPPVTERADYTLGEPLGAGGMGVVYEATQRSINRNVAVKMLKTEAAGRRDRRDSLATEAIVTGELTHPNIVPIHDLGQDSRGQLFYSMKRVEGDRWDEVLSQKSEAENLEVFLKVADAIAFAHSRGVVHRDLKPENVLLGGFGEVLVMDWGLAYATGQFDKLDSITANLAMGGSPAYMAPEQATAFLIAGGWRSGKLPEITPAVDVYLLGAILFEIATGFPPHSGDDPALCVVAASENRIRDVESKSDLVPIALQAMETEPADRFSSVEKLQAAVREYSRNSESVALADRAATLMHSGDLARAVVGFEDALELWPGNPRATSQVTVARRKLARRRYALTAMTAAFLLAIGVGGVGINYQRQKAEQANVDLAASNGKLEHSIKLEQDAKKRANDSAERANESAKRAVHSANLAKKIRVLAQIDERRAEKAARQEKLASAAAEEARRTAVAAQSVAEREQERQRYQNYQGRIKLIDARIAENAFAEAERLLDQLADESPDLCGWDWGRLKYLCTQGRRSLDSEAPITAAAAAADGALLVTGDTHGQLRMWRFGETVATHPSPDQRLPDIGFDRVTAVAISPDGKTIAASGTGSADVVVVSVETPQSKPMRLSASRLSDASTMSLGFTADGSRLLSAGEGGLTVWETATGRVLASDGVARSSRGRLPVTCAAISPDGTLVAAGLADGQVLVWQSNEIEALFAETLVFDGHRLQAEFGDGFQFLSGRVTALAFLPDGRTIVSGDQSGRLLRWNAGLAKQRNDERDLADALDSAVAATTEAGSNGFDSRRESAQVAEIVAHASAVSTIVVKSDERGRPTIVTGGDDGLIKVWKDVATGPDIATSVRPPVVLRGHEGHIVSVAGFELPGLGLNIFSAGIDARNRLWNVANYAEVRDVSPQVFADHQQEILDARFSPDGRRLLTAGRDEKLVVTDLDDPEAEPFQSIKVHGDAISVPWIVPFRDGKRLATGYYDGSFAIWSVAGRTTLARVTPFVGSSLTPPTVSNDGQWIAASFRRNPEDRAIAVWSVENLTARTAATPAPEFVFEPRGEIFAAIFTTDGRLAFGDRSGPDRPAGGHVYVADLATGDLATHRLFGDGVEGRVYGLKPLPGGEILAAGSPAVGSPVQVVSVDTATGEATGKVLSLAGTFLSGMSISTNGSRLATLTNVGGDRAQSLELWNLSTGERLWETTLTETRGTAIDISPDGRTLLLVANPVRRDGQNITATGASEVRLLDVETGQERRFGRQSDEPLLSASVVGNSISGGTWSTDGTSLFLAGIHGVSEWNLSTREQIPGAFDSHGAIATTGFSQDGRYIIDGYRDGSFEVRDAGTPHLSPVYHEPPVGSRGAVTATDFSPKTGSTRFLIGTGGSLTLREFDANANQSTVLQEFVAESSDRSLSVRAVAFSIDERWVAAACDDGAARVWDTQKREPAFVLARNAGAAATAGHDGAVTAIAFPQTAVRDGFLVLATGGADRNTLVWVIDVQSGQVAASVQLRGHREEITDLDFFPGRFDTLITASGDRTAKVWDWDRGGLQSWSESDFASLGEPDEVLTLAERHTAGLTAVDVSSDGRMVLTAGRDGRAILWPSIAPEGLQ